MNRNTILAAVVALIVGLGVGLTVRASMSSSKSKSQDSMNHKMDTPPPSSQPALKRVGFSNDGLKALSTLVFDVKNPKCPIMKNPVKEESFAIVYNGLLVRFCCPGCDGGFLEKPGLLLAKMKEDGLTIPASALLVDSNPKVIDAKNTFCPISGETIGDSILYVVHEGVKVHVKDEAAILAFAADPSASLLEASKSGSIPANRLGEVK